MASVYGFDAAGVERIRRTVRAVEGAIPRLEVVRNHRDLARGGASIVFGVLTTGASGASGAAGFTAAALGVAGEVTTSGDEIAVIVPRLQ